MCLDDRAPSNRLAQLLRAGLIAERASASGADLSAFASCTLSYFLLS